MEHLLNNYDNYCAEGLEKRMVLHEELIKRIKTLPTIYRVAQIGESFEGRAIHSVRVGNGSTRVLLWTQMHGDESTATRSIFDVFNFLAMNDEWNKFRETILQTLDMQFIPMLNPDGAVRWQRETAQQIDMNRDARKTVTPEAVLLQSIAKSFSPQFAFNLHDQSKYYSAGFSRNPATITLQAPPLDANETITATRKQAIQLLVLLNKKLQQQIPNCVGRWNDDYEPRAFGEWFQAQRAATVLIESGACYNDPERNKIKRLHFAILLNALYAIATNAMAQEDILSYKAIPLNRKEGMFDRMERGKEIMINGKTFISDVGYRDEGEIQEIGDLANFGSLQGSEC